MPSLLLLVAALLLAATVSSVYTTERGLLAAIERGDAPGSSATQSRALQRLVRAGVVREEAGRLRVDAAQRDRLERARRRNAIRLGVGLLVLLAVSAVITKRVLDAAG
ncbi:hypothetical protein [Gemmatimonas sp.]|jgi:hypothetical protein|uniref:hypothetical protein n=1 Tax=Gemmatimonas sp. TaxID=1962908 RepID=UPI00333F1365